MQFSSSYNYDRECKESSDNDLESGLKPSNTKTPNMELQFASSAKKESRSNYQNNKLDLPTKKGSEAYQIYNKPQQNVISGKNPKFISSPMGSSQQLREIFESTPKNPEPKKPEPKDTTKVDKDIKSKLYMQKQLNEMIKQHVNAEPITVQQYPHSPRSTSSRYGESISTFQTQASGFPSGSSRDAKMTIFSSVPNFPKEQQRLGALKLGQSTVSGIELNFQEAPSSSKLLKELKPKTIAHFFESPSKYISLKAFNGQNQEQYSDGLDSLKSDQITSSKDATRFKIIKNWFKELSIAEKSVVLTTIDKELVRLLRSMYRTQQKFGVSGKYIARLDYCNTPAEAEHYEKVAGYNLLFVKEKSNPKQVYSKTIQEKLGACNWLVEGLRFLPIKTQEEDDDEMSINALTLDVDVYSNVPYFMKMMKMIDQEFLMREYTCTKFQQPVEGSLLTVPIPEAQQQKQPSRSQKNLKAQKNSSALVRDKAYFLLQDTHRPIFNSSQSPESERQIGQYQAMKQFGETEEKKCIELAQVILFIVEKGINIQFLDFLDKIQAVQQHNFFFFKMKDLATDVLTDDLKVAHYWFTLPLDVKEKQLDALNPISKDLLKMYNESKEFDNIKETEEEDSSSLHVDSDSDAMDSDDFSSFNINSKFPKYKKKLGMAKQPKHLAQEYHEFESGKLETETMIVKKPRRGRKDRTRGPNGEKSVTTSSSGLDQINSYCDYNVNQLRAQYQGVEERDEEVDDIETGANYEFIKRQTLDGLKRHKSKYECMADMVVDPIPSDSSSQKALIEDENTSSNVDPEDLRPYNYNDTVFSNQPNFDYQNFQNLSKHQEEAKIPVFIKQQYKTPKIQVSLTDYTFDAPRNDLFGASKPDNQLFAFKQSIKVAGLKAQDSFFDSLIFVKMLSACKDFEAIIKEFDYQQTKNKNSFGGNAMKQQLKMQDIKTMMQSRFYKQLSQFCTDKILADLLEPEPAKKAAKVSNNKPKVEQQKQVKQPPQKPNENQPNFPNQVQNQGQTSQGGKKKNKKKNKKKKKQQQVVSTEAVLVQVQEVPRKKEKLSDDETSLIEDGDVQLLAAELGKYVDASCGYGGEVADATEVITNQSNDESVTSSCIERIQNYQKANMQQNELLLDLQSRYEQLETCEEMLNNHVDAEDVEQMLLKTQIQYQNKLEDFEASSEHLSDEDNNEAIQRMLNRMPLMPLTVKLTENELTGFPESESELRFKEERTGLLSNQVHLEKYHQETMHELELIEKRKASPTYQNLDMLDYILKHNREENKNLKQIRKPSPSNQYQQHQIMRAQNMYQNNSDWSHRDCSSEGSTGETMRAKYPNISTIKKVDLKKQQLLDEDTAPPLSELKKVHQSLLGPKNPLPDGMTARQREVVLRILLDQVEKQKQLLDQSGGAAEESKKGSVPLVQETQQLEESKYKKKKKNNKKNRRKPKESMYVAAQQQIKPVVEQSKPVQESIEVVEADVEEVILVEDSPSKNRKLDKSVLRNNYLVEDAPPKQQRVVSSVESGAITILIQKIEEVKVSVAEEVFDREDFVQGITSKLIQNAVQSCTESPQNPVLTKTNMNTGNAGNAGRNRKNGKGKPTQEMHFQQKVKQPLKKPATSGTGLSQLSSDAASQGNTTSGVPVYCSTPIVNKEPKNPASVVSFKADLSDNVKIPQRGTSNSSYGKEEKFHEQTLLELDSLFPSASKDKRNGSGSLKIRSSTVSKERFGIGNTKNQIFDKTSRLSHYNIKNTQSDKNDDVQSQKVQKSRKCEPEDLKEEKPAVVSKVESKPIESPPAKEEVRADLEEPKPITKSQRKQINKAKKKKKEEQMELEKTETEAKEAQKLESKDFPTEDHSKVQEPEPKPQPQQQHQSKKDKQQKSNYQPQYTAKDNSKVNLQYVAKQPVPQKKQETPQQKIAKVAETKVEETKPVVIQQTKQVEATKQTKSQKKETKPPSKTLQSANYTSFDAMFESVYGDKAISGIPIPAVAEKRPEEVKKAPQKDHQVQAQAKPVQKQQKGVQAKPAEAKIIAAKVEEKIVVFEEPSFEEIESQKKRNMSKSKEKKPSSAQKKADMSLVVKQVKDVIEKEVDVEVFDEINQKVLKQTSVQKSNLKQSQQLTRSSFQTPSSLNASQQQSQQMQYSYNQQYEYTQQRQQDSTYVKRNRGAQFPPTSDGTAVTNATPTVASNSSQTLNIQQITQQQQSNNFTVNLNIQLNQKQPPFTPYNNPQQMFQQQQMQHYMYSLAQQQQFINPAMQFNGPQMYMPYNQQGFNPQQFIRPMGSHLMPADSSITITQKSSKEEKKGEISVTNDSAEPVQINQFQQQMNQTKTELDQSPDKPKSQTSVFTYPTITQSRPATMPLQSNNFYQMPYAGQKQPMYQQFPGHLPFGMVQLTPVFQFVHLSVHLQHMIAPQEQAFALNMANKFSVLLGKQILKIQAKIEDRLKQIEDLKTLTFTRIQQIAKATFTDAQSLDFEIYGSIATKLAIDTSDMDIAVYGVVPIDKINSSANVRELTVSAMDQLNTRFDAIQWIANNRVIGTASVPVIKLEVDLQKLAKTLNKDERTTDEPEIKSLKIDIIFNDSALPRTKVGADGVIDTSECLTKRCAEYVKQQIIDHPFLKPLAMVLKKYLSLKNLNNSFMGTISSYGLVLMILALLQDFTRGDPKFEKEYFEFNLGRALIHFFQVFGESFQTQYYLINTKNEFAEASESLGQLNTNGSYVLQITDPCNDQNNVGKQTYKFEEVQDQFNITLQCLIVRFKDFYQGESQMLELQRRKDLVDGALMQYTQMPHHMPTEIGKYDTEQTQSLFGNFEVDPLKDQSFWSQSNQMYCFQNLLKRGSTQLKVDSKEAADCVAKFALEKDHKAQSILDRIIMVDSDDLTPLIHDEEEERQKIVVTFAQKAISLFQNPAYDRQLSQDVYQGSTDIQELLTGQHNPQMIPNMQYYPQQNVGYMNQGYYQYNNMHPRQYTNQPYYVRSYDQEYQQRHYQSYPKFQQIAETTQQTTQVDVKRKKESKKQ